MPRMWLSPSPRILSRDAVEDERLVLERFERLEAFFEDEFAAEFFGPEVFGDHAVGAEHDDQALAARAGRFGGKAEAGEVQHERHRGGAEAEVAEELAAGGVGGHGVSSSILLFTTKGTKSTKKNSLVGELSYFVSFVIFVVES